MDPHIQHDPKTKLYIREALYDFLYAPVEKQRQARLDALIIKNCLLMKYSHKSFMYKGECYSCDSSTPPRKANRLSPELVPEMEQYLKELKELNNKEIPYVVGYINQVLNSSNDLCDYLELLPSTLHAPIREYIAACPCRTRHLAPSEIDEIQHKNLTSIDLIKSRMVTNLLL